MPVLHVPVERLRERLQEPVPEDRLERALAMMGCVPEETDGPEWAIEVFPDRPDLLSAEHLARAVRAYLGQDPGLDAYPVDDPGPTLSVEQSVQGVRGVIVGGTATGVELDEDALAGLMDLQEDLHWGLGARRRKVSVGLHDARDLEPPFTYRGVDPDEVRFVPLRGRESMTMRRMLKEVDKGQEHAHLVEGHDRWPLIVDDEDQVLSFPPIINGTVTTLTEDTTDVFVDVTGQDERACRRVLNIVTTQLAELGGDLGAVEVDRPTGTVTTPDLSPTEHRVERSRIEDLLGIQVPADDAARALERIGHAARPDGDELAVDVGAWRADVLHPVDLVEDVAVGIGYDRLDGQDPRAVTFGQAGERETLDEQVRRVLTGLGYLECITLTLTSRAEQTDLVDADDPLVAVENPVSNKQEVLRRRLLPGLLTLAADNTHRDLPQHLCEVGDVVLPRADGAPRNEHRVAGLIVAADASFTQVKAHVEALLRGLDVEADEEAGEHPGLVDGRTAVLRRREDTELLGVYGEVAPATLERFDLEAPCAGFELALGATPERATWSPRDA